MKILMKEHDLELLFILVGSSTLFILTSIDIYANVWLYCAFVYFVVCILVIHALVMQEKTFAGKRQRAVQKEE